jgi:hypothetical protein
MPGIFVQTVAFTLASTAVGLTADMQKGPEQPGAPQRHY